MKKNLFAVIIICMEALFLLAQSPEKNIMVQKPELRQEILEMFKKDNSGNKGQEDKSRKPDRFGRR
jgi:hypothetical protein